MRPEIILLDEITSALDPELAAGILKIIKHLAKDGITLLIVTHHLKFAREVSDRIVFLDQGTIIEEGMPEQVLEYPRSGRLKKFLENEQETKQEITVYEGFEDFQAFHVGLLKRMPHGSTGYVVGAVGDQWFESMGTAYREYEKLLRDKNITWKWVSYKVEPREREIQKQLGARLHIRLIPKEYATPSNFNIWDDTIILQTFGDPPAVIEIRNKYLVKGYMNYFNLLWEMGHNV